MHSYTYLIINIATISIPFLVSFSKRFYFYETWKEAWYSICLTAFVFILWDIAFTSFGIWGFNQDYLIGINLFSLPLEEILFFFCIPYACLFTYFCIKQSNLSVQFKLITVTTYLIIGLLLVLGILFYNKLYTSITFTLTSIALLLVFLKYKTKYLPHFYMAYIIIFIGPFLIVNGMLTGSFISNPVVWYDNTENLGLRVFTIPIEDFVYGFLLYLSNIILYEFFLRKKSDATFRKT